MTREDRIGWLGWAALATYVVCWDRWAPQTLSRTWWRGSVSPVVRAGEWAACGWLVAHLMRVDDRRRAPLTRR